MTAMYRRILVAVENSAADQTILTHVGELARLTGSTLVLVHVADGWAARHFDELQLRESEEMKADRAYLDTLKDQLTAHGRVHSGHHVVDRATGRYEAGDACAGAGHHGLFDLGNAERDHLRRRHRPANRVPGVKTAGNGDVDQQRIRAQIGNPARRLRQIRGTDHLNRREL